MKFAKWTFLIAGIYGLAVLLPMYFRKPPAEHSEFFYGFVGIAVAWQVLFLVISRDPARWRPAMIAGVLEKLAFGIPAIVLYSQGRLEKDMLAGGLLDLVLGTLFVISWLRTR